MSAAAGRFDAWLREGAGLCVAVFLILGRWSPARIMEASPWAVGPDLRVALLGALVLLVLVELRARGGALLRAEVLLPALLGICLFVVIFLRTPFARAPVPADLAWDLAVLAAVLAAIGVLGGRLELEGAVWRWVGVVLMFLMVWAYAAGTGQRITVGGGGPIVLGRNMAILMSLLLLWRGWLPGALAVATVPFAGLLVVLTGSRGALLAAVVGVGLALWLRLRTAGVRGTVVLLGAAALVLVPASLVVGARADRAVEVFQSRIIGLTLERQYVTGRDTLLVHAAETWKSSPVVGYGLQGMRERGVEAYPHNLALDLLVSAGLLGIAVVVGVVVWWWRQVRGGRLAPPAHATLCVLAVWFVAAQFSGDLYDSRGVFVAAWLGMLGGALRAPPLATRRAHAEEGLRP